MIIVRRWSLMSSNVQLWMSTTSNLYQSLYSTKNTLALKNIGVIYDSENPWPNIPVMAVVSVTSPTKRIAPRGTHYNLYIQRQGRHPEEKMFLGEAIIYTQLPIVQKLPSSLRSTTHTTNTPEKKRHCDPMTLTHWVELSESHTPPPWPTKTKRVPLPQP
jgi:hypothetical protein